MKKHKELFFRMKLKNRAMLSMLTGMLVLTISAAIVSFVTYTNAMKNQYGDQAMNLAKTVAVVADSNDVKVLTDKVMEIYHSRCNADGSAPDFSSMTQAELDEYYAAFSSVYEMPEYKRLFTRLYSVKERNEVLWVYLCYMDIQTNQAVYIIDAEITEHACKIGTCDVIEERNLYMMQHNIYDFPAYITDYDEYGWLCSSAAGIRDENGTVIANAYVDISMVEVMHTSFSFLRNLIILLVVSAVIICFVYSYSIARTIVDPINQLAAATSDFISEKQNNNSEGKTQISKLQIHTGDEIETLATAIQKMEKEINYYINNLTEVTAEKERIGTELRVASKIQQETMPCIIPEFPKQKGLDLYGKMFPSATPGGDFYDVFMLDEDHMIMAVASTTEKGVPAALFMVILKSMFRNQIQEGKTLEKILFLINNQLWKENDSAIFAYLWCGILELSTGHLKYCNAGGETPYLMNDKGDSRPLQPKAKPLPLAAWEDTSYPEYEVDLNRGDVLFLYTSSIIEVCNADKEAFGMQRLQEVLNVNYKGKMDDIINKLYSEVQEFMNQVDQNNDLIMLALRYGEKLFSEEN